MLFTRITIKVNKITAAAKATVLALSMLVSSMAVANIADNKPDLEREKRMAAEVDEAVLDGEVIYLKDGEHEFQAIDMEPDEDPKGAVILLHGRGFHANWQDAIYPLRTQLPASGWRTLSVQMPVLEKEAKYYDYVPLFPKSGNRIDAAINYLKEQGVSNIVLFAHSCGAHMAMEWVRSKGDKLPQSISAYIGAGMGATDYQQKMQQPFPLAQMKVPVLDVYGEEEFPAVLRMAPERLAAIKKAGNAKSAQTVVAGANHYFTDYGDSLVTAVTQWLGTLR